MNPHIEQGLHVTRRHFLRDCRVGIGGMALASLLGDDRPKSRLAFGAPRPQGAALRAASQARHLPSHGGLAAQPGSVRLQARAGQANGAALPRRVLRGASLRLHQGHADSARHAASLCAVRRERHLAVGLPAVLGQGRGRADGHPVDADRPVQPRAGAAHVAHRFAARG